jgi:DNA-binding transcriptional ArsR family regulator
MVVTHSGKFAALIWVDFHISNYLYIDMTQAVQLTAVMKTLADPTRRAVFERIADGGEVAATALVKGLKVSQPAVSQHLRALRDAGLVTERREGRHIYYRPAPKGLTPLADWLGYYEAFWRERFDKLEKLLKEDE